MRREDDVIQPLKPAELEEKSEELSLKLGVRQREIERQLDYLTAACALVSEYRIAVQTMKEYGYKVA
jgi:hypothetical protein